MTGTRSEGEVIRHGWMDRREGDMDGWMDVWVGGWMVDGWMGGRWVRGWADGGLREGEPRMRGMEQK